MHGSSPGSPPCPYGVGVQRLGVYPGHTAVLRSFFDWKKDTDLEKPDFLRFDPAHPDVTVSKPDADNLGPTYQILDLLAD